MTTVPQMKMKKVDTRAMTPTRAYDNAAGTDLYVSHLIDVKGGVAKFGTGWALECPKGHYIEIVVRSSTPGAGWTLANCTGIIDEDYRGEIMVLLQPTTMSGSRDMESLTNDLVGKLPLPLVQAIVKKKVEVEWIEVDDLTTTRRGDGGFGSSG